MVVGPRADGLIGHFPEARPPGVVPVLVPPTVFEEEQTVFDMPVLADPFQQLVGADRVGIATTGEVPRVAPDLRLATTTLLGQLLALLRHLGLSMHSTSE